MKKIYLLAASALVAFGMTSCDIDNVENVGELAGGTFPVTEDDGLAALAGIYENLNATHAYPQESFLYNAALASDDHLGGGGDNDFLMQAEDLLCNHGTDMTNDFYKLRYEGINRANSLIQALPSCSLEDDTRNTFMGEALFLRAFYYYELASMYGNVPVRTVPGGELLVQGNIDDPWKQILQDLRDAVSLLPAAKTSDSQAGHVDKYAAEAMLGRAWLFYAGMFCNGTTIADMTSTTYNEDAITSVELPDGTTLTKQDVITAIDDCVNNSGYSLVPDFRNLWAYTNRCTVEDYDYTAGQGLKWVEDDNAINPESMFAIKFNRLASWNTTIGYANGIALHFGVRGGQKYANTFPFGQGWGAGPVAPNLVSDWKAAEPNDIRRDATIQDWSNSETYAYGGWSDFVQETDFYGKKWAPISAKNADVDGGYSCTFENLMFSGQWLNGAENMQTNNIHDLVLIRFADVLLMQSELKKDTKGINLVRERAGLPAISSYSLKALQNERRWEFACEGIRWNDIRRWHIAAAALEKQTGQPTYWRGKADTNKAHNGGYASRYNATAGFQKMPDTQISMGTVVQNDGWTDAQSEYASW
ncbi:MAG: RagB/SusD family nutrient uptake outer membrane protein [Prevotella sp.]